VTKSRDSAVHGVVVVDKPSGLSSHDVVSRVRRILNTRRVGHAGTLDPLATGVLVMMVGEATKLSGYLTLDDKSYDAEVALGVATDTLDAEGTIIDRAQLPTWLHDAQEARPRVEEALQIERERVTQIPPLYSAIKVDGRAGYKRARAGETLELAARAVAVHDLQFDALQPPHLKLRLKVSKGYYVRSLARDLGQSLALPAHLSALRRTASGAFTLGHATALDALHSASLIPTTEAARLVMPIARLTDSGVKRARFGQALDAGDFEESPDPGLAAWLGTDGALVAVGVFEDDKGAVRRGFNV